MKIVHVLSALTKGGGERVVVELANKAAEKGDDITILAAWPVNPEFLQNSINTNVKVRFVGKTKKSAYFKIIIWIIRNRSWLSSCDVLHCHLTFGAVFGSITKLILKKIFLKRKPIIVETYHAVGMPIPKFNRWVHSRMALMRDGLVLMAKDPYWNSFIERHPGLTYNLIPNGIAMLTTYKTEERRQEFKKKMGISHNCKFLIGTVGMLRPDRKPDLYIPICKDIYTALGNDAHFVLGGDGVELENIKSLISEYKLSDTVHMPGLIKVAADTISNLDVYVSVSVGKTTGISMIEAAMCKVPVVGIQLIKDYTATAGDWVWSHNNLAKVADRIIFLLQNEEERKKLANKQYEYVANNFTSDAMYKSYDAFYKKIIAI
jgi:glycosyltransferase involved in cell wall biosynthesis